MADTDSTRVKLVITLVHGTFARKAKWVLPSSELSQKLKAEVAGEVQIERFYWSGQNAQISRERAADALREHIRGVDVASRQAGYQARQVIVAHSHAGNVALMALNDVEDQQRVAGVACLGTPFLYFRQSTAAAAMTFFGFLPLALLLMVGFVAGVNALAAHLGVTVSEQVSGALAAVVFALATWLMINYTDRWLGFASLDKLRLPDLPRDRLLLVRTIGDEASGLLAGTGMMSWLSVIMYSLPTRTLEFIKERIIRSPVGIALAVCIVVALGALNHFADSDPLLTSLNDGLTYYLNLIALWVFIVFPFVLAVLRLIAMLAVGWDVPFRFFGLMVTAEVTPNSGTYSLHMLRAKADAVRSIDEYAAAHRANTTSDRSTYEALKHSEVYEHPLALDLLVRWINSLAKAGGNLR